MSNFANISNALEGAINTQIAAARSSQGVWEWFNTLQRIMSANRFQGTPKIYGLRQLAAGTNVIETVAAKVFGFLIDNSMAAEDLVLGLSNVAATPGTTDARGLFWGPRNAITTYTAPEPIDFSSRLEVYSMLGTNAGYEAGTASTTQPSVIVVYTV
jgi:hypothetical protein